MYHKVGLEKMLEVLKTFPIVELMKIGTNSQFLLTLLLAEGRQSSSLTPNVFGPIFFPFFMMLIPHAALILSSVRVGERDETHI